LLLVPGVTAVKKVQSDRASGRARFDQDHVVLSALGHASEDFVDQAAMAVEHANAAPLLQILEDEVQQQAALARSCRPHDTDAPQPVDLTQQDRSTVRRVAPQADRAWCRDAGSGREVDLFTGSVADDRDVVLALLLRRPIHYHEWDFSIGWPASRIGGRDDE